MSTAKLRTWLIASALLLLFAVVAPRDTEAQTQLLLTDFDDTVEFAAVIVVGEAATWYGRGRFGTHGNGGLLGRIVINVGHGSGTDSDHYGYSTSYGALDSGEFPADLFADGNSRTIDSIYEDGDGAWYLIYTGGTTADWLTDQEQLDNISVEVAYEDDRDFRSFVLGGFIDERTGSYTLKLEPPLPDRDWDGHDDHDVIIAFWRLTADSPAAATVTVTDPVTEPNSLAGFVKMVTPGGGIMVQLMLVVAYAAAMLFRQPRGAKAILLSGVGFVVIPLVPVALGFGEAVAAGIIFLNTGLGAFAYKTILARTE